MTIEKIYKGLCKTPSDINELLPYIKAVATHCDHITELGVRNPTSTYALLAGNPKKLVSYDIVRYPEVDLVEQLAPNFTFVLGSSLKIEIEETDFLFIDTYHTQTQLELELAKHAKSVRKYLGFHDTWSYRFVGEAPTEKIIGGLACGRGIWPAIENFLSLNDDWTIDFETEINNGLTILRKKSATKKTVPYWTAHILEWRFIKRKLSRMLKRQRLDT